MILVCAILVVGCTATTKEELTESGLKRSDFQTEVNGEKTDLFVLKNKNNMEVCITNFGGRIVSVMVPDKDGNMKDVVLGFDSIQDYIKYPSDFGALDDMPTASTKDASHWTVWSTSCHKITMAIVCMVGRKVSSTVYTKEYKRTIKKYN